ncbi:hypothetical protein [Mycoplasmopsis agalactiae]|uniref:hypothetical protein n=1 Tax=Mycoplasmopsis agalactiae TaxID=2110 RepID=UPI001F49013E|nr:hypothetical protein [Mycoplasmopsis agalactiae]MCE6115261.1 hypothetical protein [Mycoplasmopsis agalactiae]
MTNSEKLKNLEKTKKFSIAYLALVLSMIVITIITSIVAYVVVKSEVPKYIYNIDPKTFNPENYLKHSASTWPIWAFLIIYLLVFPTYIAAFIILIFAAIIAHNQKYLVLFILGVTIPLIGIVGTILYLVEYKKLLNNELVKTPQMPSEEVKM